MAEILWTGDALGKLIWTCQTCGDSGSGESASGIMTGTEHRYHCPDDPHPIFDRLEMMRFNLAMTFMRAVRAGDDALRDELLAKTDAVEKVIEIAKEMYT